MIPAGLWWSQLGLTVTVAILWARVWRLERGKR